MIEGLKKIWGYVVSFFKEEVKWPYLLSIVLLVAVSIFLETRFDIENKYVLSYGRTWKTGLAYFFMYGFPFLGSYLLQAVFYPERKFLIKPKFWILIVFTLAVYAFRCYFYKHDDWVWKLSTPEYQYFWIYTIDQLTHAFLLFTPVFMYWWFVDRKNQQLYGWRWRGVNVKPYFGILLLMVPVIGIAATQSSFTDFYPLAAHIPNIDPATTKGKGLISLFEVSYGLDFLMNEFFFRGFIILTFAAIVGRGAILPMAAFYVFIHFGKPVGETISSFFGGVILGILAYETRSIAGGVIAHIGIAYMMDIAGTLARVFGSVKHP